jgi:hypothetical protein
MTVSARKGSGRAPLVIVLLGVPLPGSLWLPDLLGNLFLSNSLSRRRSLELMYIRPFVPRPVFLPQLSCDRWCFSSGVGADPRSTDRLPMLWASSFLEVAEAGEDGREATLLLRMNERRPDPLSRLVLRTEGLLGPVNGEYPLVGFEVRIMGALAARLSSDEGSWVGSSGSERV